MLRFIDAFFAWCDSLYPFRRILNILYDIYIMEDSKIIRIVFISILCIGIFHLLIKNLLHENIRTSNSVRMRINGNNAEGFCGTPQRKLVAFGEGCDPTKTFDEKEKDDLIKYIMQNYEGPQGPVYGNTPRPSNFYPGQNMNDSLFCSDNTDLSYYFNNMPRKEFASKQKKVVDMPVDCRNGIPAVMDPNGKSYTNVNLGVYDKRQESVNNGASFYGDITAYDGTSDNYASFTLLP